jgi:hypothetical protein
MAGQAVPQLVAEVRRLRGLVEYGACPTAARIDAVYGTRESVAFGVGLMGHELPEYWAYGTYYSRDHRDRHPIGDPTADADIDFGTHPVRPAPPKDSPFWTLEE